MNGHKNWTHWNVSLWLNNDESTYRLMRQCIRMTNNRDEAATRMMKHLPAETPDGAKYSKTSVNAAMVGLGGAK